MIDPGAAGSLFSDNCCHYRASHWPLRQVVNRLAVRNAVIVPTMNLVALDVREPHLALGAINPLAVERDLLLDALAFAGSNSRG